MSRFQHPPGIPSLPLPNSSPDSESENYSVVFYKLMRRFRAVIYDEREFMVDILHGRTFLECYNSVATEYPQAKWINPNA